MNSTDPAQRCVIIQAGGKGSRLEQYSWNKPKCLVPVDGKPLLYHTFDAFPGARFIVVLDYKRDIVTRFFSVFRAEVPVEVVEVAGGRGNLSGIAEALALVPEGSPVTVVWCDLRFSEPVTIGAADAIEVATTEAFPCRWSFGPDGAIVEKRSDTTGIIGLFAFPDRSWLAEAPRDGEFVAWLATTAQPVRRVAIDTVLEIGTVAALTEKWSAGGHARFFNEVRIEPDRVVKIARVADFAPLLAAETRWYHRAETLGFRHIPQRFGDDPLTLERIHGRHPFDFEARDRGKGEALARIFAGLEEMHALDGGPAVPGVARAVYLTKTIDRLRYVRALLPEMTEQETLRINGIACRNILHPRHAGLLEAVVAEAEPKLFTFAHGDPTFSNILMRASGDPVFIDPRGQFGTSWFLGDPAYDWAKLYYSVVGDYDSFNRRQFVMEMDAQGVELQIKSNGWHHLRGMFREALGERLRNVRILHALIWLSLSGYVQDDYDSILGAYFNGLSMLEDALG